MKNDVDKILKQSKHALAKASDLDALEQVRVEYLGKKGQLTALLKQLKDLSADERRIQGEVVNVAKQQFIESFKEHQATLEREKLNRELAAEQIDVTLPGRKRPTGSLHPVTLTERRINGFFTQMGFDVVAGPEIETEHYNFTALNIPEDHPARAMHDTFYFSDGHLLRTHTSPVQIRVMENQKPPFRLIAPGRVYRCDYDVSHTPMFHQVEGLLIDESANFAGLKHILSEFFNYFFERELPLRFRPSYFPFTEPSAEVDIQCTTCHGSGCRLCQETGWLEALGCGMVHPNVLSAVDIDSDQYQGWAFGMGIDRMAMLRYGINDLRILFENDVRFLSQF